MHDLVHDLACYVAGDESCIVEAGSGCERDVSLECHYVSMVIHRHVKEEFMIRKADYKSVKLRTFLTFTSDDMFTVGVQWGMMSTHLRVLDLSCIGIKELPNLLDILKHLRFLDLSGTEIRTIPASIISLQNLQMLYLSVCRQLQRLPQGIIFLSRLNHLDISYCYELTRMPRGIGRLTNIRTLPKFIVGEERGRTISELQHLSLIRGELQIKDLQLVKKGTEAVQAHLASKMGLQSLSLLWGSCASSFSGDNTNQEDVLESLWPPNNLKVLTIQGYAGTRFPSWMTTSSLCLPNLVKIYLFDVKRCECLPPLGHLPSLQDLEVHNMPELVEWSTEPISTGRGCNLCIHALKI